jgi:hypothetical protein
MQNEDRTSQGAKNEPPYFCRNWPEQFAEDITAVATRLMPPCV